VARPKRTPTADDGRGCGKIQTGKLKSTDNSSPRSGQPAGRFDKSHHSEAIFRNWLAAIRALGIRRLGGRGR
jgi:hypothetical protein